MVDSYRTKCKVFKATHFPPILLFAIPLCLLISNQLSTKLDNETTTSIFGSCSNTIALFWMKGIFQNSKKVNENLKTAFLF